MTIATLILGVVILLVGIGGQVVVGRRFAKHSFEGDRRSIRIILLLACIIVGAWLTIASTVHLLHSHVAPNASSYNSQ